METDYKLKAIAILAALFVFLASLFGIVTKDAAKIVITACATYIAGNFQGRHYAVKEYKAKAAARARAAKRKRLGA